MYYKFKINFHFSERITGLSPRSTTATTPRSKRRPSHVPEVLIPEVNEENEDLETATSPRRVFSEDQRKLVYILLYEDVFLMLLFFCLFISRTRFLDIHSYNLFAKFLDLLDLFLIPVKNK